MTESTQTSAAATARRQRHRHRIGRLRDQIFSPTTLSIYKLDSLPMSCALLMLFVVTPWSSTPHCARLLSKCGNVVILKVGHLRHGPDWFIVSHHYSGICMVLHECSQLSARAPPLPPLFAAALCGAALQYNGMRLCCVLLQGWFPFFSPHGRDAPSPCGFRR